MALELRAADQPSEKARARRKRRHPDARLTVVELAERWNVHRNLVEQHVAEGMPRLDLAAAGAKKRCLRFDLEECERWLRSRG